LKISEIAARIPDIQDPEERIARLKLAASEVIEEWKSYRGSLKKFAKDAIVGGFEKNLPNYLEKMAAPLLSGAGVAAVTTAALGAAPGLGIGLIAFVGLALLRQRAQSQSNAYRYLTAIHKARATLQLTVNVSHKAA
jgi:hypothetical protein